MTKFEYKTFQKRLEDSQLNQLGEEGWELIHHSVVAHDHRFGQYYIFKRKKRQAEESEEHSYYGD